MKYLSSAHQNTSLNFHQFYNDLDEHCTNLLHNYKIYSMWNAIDKIIGEILYNFCTLDLDGL